MINKSAQSITPCGLVNGREDQRLRITFNMPSVRYARQISAEKSMAEDLLRDGYIPVANAFQRKDCPSCDVCIPARLDLHDFHEGRNDYGRTNREHAAIRAHNSDLSTFFSEGIPEPVIEETGMPSAHAVLYERYSRARFPARPKNNAGREFQNWGLYRGLRAAHIDAVDPYSQLAGTAILHRADTVAYGTGYFYEPTAIKSNLGFYMMLEAIRIAQNMGFRYLYLGDWTTRPTKLSYKSKLTPLELLIDGKWVRHTHAMLRQEREGDAYPLASDAAKRNEQAADLLRRRAGKPRQP